MAEPKFKIGDYVIPKGCNEVNRVYPVRKGEWHREPQGPLLLMVVSITADTCYAGTQHHYHCRPCYRNAVGQDYLKFLEIELDPAPTQPLTEKE